MEKEDKLNALISLYNSILVDIAYYQSRGDSTSIMNVVPIVIIPLLEIFKVNEFIISLICLCVPLIQCLSIQRGLQAHTFVAMLRGYAANIEDSINEIIKGKYFLYNSVLIDKYIASDQSVKSKGIKTSWFVSASIHYALIGVCALLYFHYNTNTSWYAVIIVCSWYIGLAILITRMCIDFAKKESKRFDVRELAEKCSKEKYKTIC